MVQTGDLGAFLRGFSQAGGAEGISQVVGERLGPQPSLLEREELLTALQIGEEYPQLRPQLAQDVFGAFGEQLQQEWGVEDPEQLQETFWAEPERDIRDLADYVRDIPSHVYDEFDVQEIARTLAADWGVPEEQVESIIREEAGVTGEGILEDMTKPEAFEFARKHDDSPYVIQEFIRQFDPGVTEEYQLLEDPEEDVTLDDFFGPFPAGWKEDRLDLDSIAQLEQGWGATLDEVDPTEFITMKEDETVEEWLDDLPPMIRNHFEAHYDIEEIIGVLDEPVQEVDFEQYKLSAKPTKFNEALDVYKDYLERYEPGRAFELTERFFTEQDRPFDITMEEIERGVRTVVELEHWDDSIDLHGLEEEERQRIKDELPENFHTLVEDDILYWKEVPKGVDPRELVYEEQLHEYPIPEETKREIDRDPTRYIRHHPTLDGWEIWTYDVDREETVDGGAWLETLGWDETYPEITNALRGHEVTMSELNTLTTMAKRGMRDPLEIMAAEMIERRLEEREPGEDRTGTREHILPGWLGGRGGWFSTEEPDEPEVEGEPVIDETEYEMSAFVADTMESLREEYPDRYSETVYGDMRTVVSKAEDRGWDLEQLKGHIQENRDLFEAMVDTGADEMIEIVESIIDAREGAETTFEESPDVEPEAEPDVEPEEMPEDVEEVEPDITELFDVPAEDDVDLDEVDRLRSSPAFTHVLGGEDEDIETLPESEITVTDKKRREEQPLADGELMQLEYELAETDIEAEEEITAVELNFIEALIRDFEGIAESANTDEVRISTLANEILQKIRRGDPGYSELPYDFPADLAEDIRKLTGKEEVVTVEDIERLLE